MKRSGTADLPLHGGRVPPWLACRMTELVTAIAEQVILNYGQSEFLTRLSDPFWFQVYGAVMGMDWHSSGITTSVLGALKRGINPRFSELGLIVCGGRGRHSVRTPGELRAFSQKTGLEGDALARTSRLTSRIDNNAVADGFQLYLHSFVITQSGEWAVVQQGMNPDSHLAPRYHWHSTTVRNFVSAPYTAIVGQPQGEILNLVDARAKKAQNALLTVAKEPVASALKDACKLVMPMHHDVRAKNMDLKRLGAVLAVAHEANQRVSVYKYVKVGTSWKRCPPCINPKNNKPENDKVLVNGKMEVHPEGDWVCGGTKTVSGGRLLAPSMPRRSIRPRLRG
jgi:hypothetical protein